MSEINQDVIDEAQRLEALHPNDVILVFDADGIYHYVSANREKLMGFTREETYGRHYSDFVTPDYVSHAQLSLDHTVLTGESIDSGVILLAKSGQPLYFRTVGTSVDDPGEGEFVIVRARFIREL